MESQTLPQHIIDGLAKGWFKKQTRTDKFSKQKSTTYVLTPLGRFALKNKLDRK